VSLTSGPVPPWGDGDHGIGHLELIAVLRRQVSDRLAATGGQDLADADRDQRVAHLVDQVLDEYTAQRLAARQMPSIRRWRHRSPGRCGTGSPGWAP